MSDELVINRYTVDVLSPRAHDIKESERVKSDLALSVAAITSGVPDVVVDRSYDTYTTHHVHHSTGNQFCRDCVQVLAKDEHNPDDPYFG